MLFLDCKGTPREVGRQQGEALRELIHRRWAKDIEPQLARLREKNPNADDRVAAVHQRCVTFLDATAPDIVAPTGVVVTAPVAAAVVSGVVPVTATATDTVGVARVVFSVRVGTTTTEIATDTTAPYGIDWNTGAVANGAATLTATVST